MLYVSCRKDRYDDYEFTSRREHLCFEHDYDTNANAEETDAEDNDPPRDNEIKTVPYREVLQRAKNVHVVVLVHGYRNPFWNVARAYREVEQALVKRDLLKESGGVGYQLLIGYLWPGRRRRLSFPFAVGAANRAAARHFQFFLEDLCKTAKSVDLQTHSLGARVALGAMEAADEVVTIDNVMLTAAAVDNESLERNKEFYEATKHCRLVFNYHSKHDSVVKIAYRFGDLMDFDKALGCDGTQDRARLAAHTPNAVIVDCADYICGHGDYRRTKEYFDHWERILRERAVFPQFGYLEPRLPRSRCDQSGATIEI